MTIRSKLTPLSTHRVREIEEYASSVGEAAFEGASVSLNKILNNEGIDLYCDDFGDDFEGLLEFHEDAFIIFLNTAAGNIPTSPRGRFTIAHELGHFFIDEHRLAISQQRMPSLGEYANEDLEIEREADLFASRLLLPSNEFAKKLKQLPEGLKGVISLSQQFKVSIKCAALRYLSEDQVPCSLVFRSPKKQIKWKLFSKKMWNAGFRSIIAEPIARGATDLVFKDEESEWTTAPAKYLFRLPDNCHANVIFFEESIKLGDYGVLTLLRSNEEHLTSLAEVLDKRWSSV